MDVAAQLPLRDTMPLLAVKDNARRLSLIPVVPAGRADGALQTIATDPMVRAAPSHKFFAVPSEVLAEPDPDRVASITAMYDVLLSTRNTPAVGCHAPGRRLLRVGRPNLLMLFDEGNPSLPAISRT